MSLSPHVPIIFCEAAAKNPPRWSSRARNLLVQPGRNRFKLQCKCNPKENSAQQTGDENFEGLTPEEDWEVPGGPNDSLSSNTELGRAVRETCEELEHLSDVELEVMSNAFPLMKKLGYKGPSPEEMRRQEQIKRENEAKAERNS